MTKADDLPSLLAGAERAAFHDGPALAVERIEPALLAARSQGATVEAAAAGWLLGVALAAAGRYGGALTVLTPLFEDARVEASDPTSAQARVFGALAGATIASVHRQLGRHAVAQACDLEALAMTGGEGEAAFDAELGLASDAVGLDDPTQAASRLARAAALLPAEVPADVPVEAAGEGLDPWWRQRVRLGWTTAELLALEGQLDEAVEQAQRSVELAERASAPRHVAKGLLIVGIAQVSGGSSAADRGAGGQDSEELAAGTLLRAAELAEELGCQPLAWPARALLGALVGEQDVEQGRLHLQAARSTVRAVADDLPPGVRSQWLARPDVAALLAG